MSRVINSKYAKARKEFRKDLYQVAKDNKSMVVMIVKTYAASKHRTHILKIWSLLGHNHKEAYKDYCDNLIGNHLTGRDEIMQSLCFVDNELYLKYRGKIPERMAMGDALAVAYSLLNKEE